MSLARKPQSKTVRTIESLKFAYQYFTCTAIFSVALLIGEAGIEECLLSQA